MKRQLEDIDSEDNLARKRAKLGMEESSVPYQLLPSDVIQIIMKYACHGDIYTVLSFLQAAKTCQKMLDDESWKLLFLKNIHRRRKELFDSNQLLGELQNNLSACPSDYIEAQFYDINSAWKNRYMYCAQLERDGATPEEFKADPDELYDLSENSLVIYKCDNTDTIVYGNLEKIETANNDYIMAMLESTSLEQNGLEVPLENNCTVYQAVINFSGAPVKIRFETLKEEIGREVEKLYCNSRLLAYNEKTSAWDVVFAQYSNHATDEDEMHGYMPYLVDFYNALMPKTNFVPGEIWMVLASTAEIPERYYEFRPTNGTKAPAVGAYFSQYGTTILKPINIVTFGIPT